MYQIVRKKFVFFSFLFFFFFLSKSFAAKLSLLQTWNAVSHAHASWNVLGDVSYQTQNRFLGFHIHGLWDLQTKPFSDSEADIPKLFIHSAQLFKNHQFFFGRKRWSNTQLENTFALGVLEPIWEENPIFPTPTGSLGFFYHWSQQTLPLTVFFSPMTLPNRGLPIQWTQPHPKGKRHWQPQVPTQVQIDQSTFPLKTALSLPPFPKWFWSPSFGLQSSWMSSPFKTSFFYTYGPRPAFLLTQESFLNASTTTLEVSLLPVQTFHHMTGLEIHTHFSRVHPWITLAFEKNILKNPISSSADFSWIPSAWFLGSGMELKNTFGNWSLSYLRILPTSIQTHAHDLPSSALPAFYPFQNLLQLKWEKSISSFFLFSTLFRWDFTFQTQSWWTQGTFALWKGLQIHLSSLFSRGSRFLGRDGLFLGQDRFEGALAYVF